METQTNTKWKLNLISGLLMAIATAFTGCATHRSVSPEAHAALSQLVDRSPAAALLATKAKGILVFPDILKGGFIFSAHDGDGAMIQGGQTTGFYNIAGVSYGFLAGLQSYSYALFFMTDEDLEYLNRSHGWEFGGGPSIVALNAGMAGSLTTTTIRKGVYSFFFNQQGLMGALDLQGAKITRIGR